MFLFVIWNGTSLDDTWNNFRFSVQNPAKPLVIRCSLVIQWKLMIQINSCDTSLAFESYLLHFDNLQNTSYRGWHNTLEWRPDGRNCTTNDDIRHFLVFLCSNIFGELFVDGQLWRFLENETKQPSIGECMFCHCKPKKLTFNAWIVFLWLWYPFRHIPNTMTSIPKMIASCK